MAINYTFQFKKRMLHLGVYSSACYSPLLEIALSQSTAQIVPWTGGFTLTYTTLARVLGLYRVALLVAAMLPTYTLHRLVWHYRYGITFERKFKEYVKHDLVYESTVKIFSKKPLPKFSFKFSMFGR